MRFTSALTTAILAFTSASTAFPQATGVAVARQESGDSDTLAGPVEGEDSIIDMSNYPNSHGAVALAESYRTQTAAPEQTGGPVIQAASGPLTIKLVNAFGKPLSTAKAHNAGGPAPISGKLSPGTLAAGATGTLVVPTSWAGNWAVVQAGSGRKIVGDESLIEGSFMKQGGSQAIIDIDVSYVSGFSVPIVCSCSGHGVVTGCSNNLWNMNKCPNDNGVGSCKNPMRGADYDGAVPSAFFKPCRGAAFTVPRDPGANSNGICTDHTITCCVGTANCPRNPRQA